MEPEDYQAVLERYDAPDPEHAEYPPSVDWLEEDTRFKAFLGDLQTAMGMKLWVDESPQDAASFHSEVFIPREGECRTDEPVAGTVVVAGGVRIVGVSLRFSNFGNLAAVNDEEESISPETLELVKALLARHGYTYIPHSAWEGPYTGKNPCFTEKAWWFRYFDYV